MIPPKDRAELVEVMAARLWFREFSMPWDKATRIQKDRFYRSARDTLETLEAAGVALVPVAHLREVYDEGCEQGRDEATSFEWGCSPSMRRDARFAQFCASPYAPPPEARSDGE